VAGLIGREAVRVGRDRISRHAGVPRTVGAVDAAYLGRVLGVPVRAVTRLHATNGTTDRTTFAVEGAGLPATVFVKTGAASPVVRFFGNLASLGENEVRFYRDVRPLLDIEAPVALGVAEDAATKRFVLVLEDLTARPATFVDVLTPLTVPRAEAVVDTLARLHGSQWQHPLLDRHDEQGLGWIRANSDDPLLPTVTRAVQLIGRRLARKDPALIPAAGRALLRAYPAVARRLDEGPHTILHGDPHPGNCYFVDGRAGLLDWQAIRRGHPLRDLAYFLVLALDPETRRRHQIQLLERYCEALRAAGGPSLGAGEAWGTYRSMAAYPFVAATFTAGFGGLQSQAIAQEGLRRAAAAVVELDTLPALDLPRRP
jgi:hypothetical protein